ncbi:hypothetical protein CRENBAI_005616 [Crenichthys baileyi]|uniref:Secreted protein n=1 Tax=Crenichthys baileyi TaxID=28760 RepID=A0AAV9RN97_9TELE
MSAWAFWSQVLSFPALGCFVLQAFHVLITLTTGGIEVVSERACMFPSSAMAGGGGKRANGVKAVDGKN